MKKTLTIGAYTCGSLAVLFVLALTSALSPIVFAAALGGLMIFLCG